MTYMSRAITTKSRQLTKIEAKSMQLTKSRQSRGSPRNQGKVEEAIDTNLVKVEALEIDFEAAKKQDKVSS